MKRWLRSLLGKIDQLTLRERLLLGIVLLVAIWAAMDLILFTPLERARQAERARLQDIQARIAQMQAQLSQHEQRLNAPDAARQRWQAAQNALRAQAGVKDSIERYFVSAETMADVLQALTRERPGLKLLALESLPPQPLASEQVVSSKTVYRLGMVLSVGGNYAALVHYLQEVEQLPTRFFWAKATLDAHDYPELVLTLTLYSLSTDKVWLRL